LRASAFCACWTVWHNECIPGGRSADCADGWSRWRGAAAFGVGTGCGCRGCRFGFNDAARSSYCAGIFMAHGIESWAVSTVLLDCGCNIWLACSALYDSGHG
jgi:hypothetical protein